jgi:hypothetical protein
MRRLLDGDREDSMTKPKNPAAVALAALRKNPGRKAVIFPCPWCGERQEGIADFRAHIPACEKGPAKNGPSARQPRA